MIGILAGFACSWVAAPTEFARAAPFTGTAEQAAHAVERLVPPGTPIRVAESRMEALAFSCTFKVGERTPSMLDHFEEMRTLGKAHGTIATYRSTALSCGRDDEPLFWEGIRQWSIYFSVDDGLVLAVAVDVRVPSL